MLKYWNNKAVFLFAPQKTAASSCPVFGSATALLFHIYEWWCTPEYSLCSPLQWVGAPNRNLETLKKGSTTGKRFFNSDRRLPIWKSNRNTPKRTSKIKKVCMRQETKTSFMTSTPLLAPLLKTTQLSFPSIIITPKISESKIDSQIYLQILKNTSIQIHLKFASS